MDFIQLLMLSISLAMDAFAVSVTSGILLRRPTPGPVLKIAVFFGGFQALMPTLGWLLGRTVADYVESLDNWIAFLILGFIGGKMIWEAFRTGEEQEESADPAATGRLLVMAVATSIDAFAVGMSLALLDVGILSSALIIGLVTFFLCLMGVLLGRFLGALWRKGAMVAGGIILLGLGVHILLT